MSNILAKPGNKTLLTGILIALLFYPLLGQLFLSGNAYSVKSLFISRLLIWLELAVLYVYAHKAEQNKFMLWPETAYRFGFYLRWLVMLYFLVFVAGIISNMPKLLGWHDDFKIMIRLMALVNTNVPLLVFTAITAGVTEELIFRAYMMPRLEMLFKDKYVPVIISALFFGGIHYRYFNLKEVIFAFLFGIVFAMHYQKYRNIRILILMHALVDFIAFLIFRTAISRHLPVR